MANSSCQAQSAATARRHEIDLAVTYTAERSNLVSTPIFWRQGGAIEFSADLCHGLGVAANVDGSYIGNINGSGIDLKSVTATFGPRYEWSPGSRKYSVFGEGLVGNAKGFDSVFPDHNGVLKADDTFALQVGGGLDWRIGRRFAVRPIQADWVRTGFPNANSNIQNSLRLGGGLVLRLGRH